MSAPAIPPVTPPARPPKKMYLWTLAAITYALVIVLTVFAVWSYRYLEAKTRHQRELEGTGVARPLPIKPQP